MRIILSTLSVAALLCTNAQAQFADKFYIGAEVGMLSPLKKELAIQKKYIDSKLSLEKFVYSGGVKAGYFFLPGFAVELGANTVSPLSMKLKNQKTSTKMSLLSLKVVINPIELGGFNPYIFGGVGLSLMSMKELNMKININIPNLGQVPTNVKMNKMDAKVLSYVAGLGCTVRLAAGLNLDFRGEFVITPNVKASGEVSALSIAMNKKFEDKVTLGTGEFKIGLTYGL